MSRGVAALACLIALSGCLPAFTLFQRPATLEPGQVQVGVNASVMGFAGQPFANASSPPDPSAEQSLDPIPNVEVSVRRGLAPNVDAGVRLWVVGAGLGVDVKWRFLKTDTFELALAPAVAIDLVSILGLLQAKPTAFAAPSAYLPLIASVRTGPHQLFFGLRGVAAVYAVSSGTSSGAVPLVIPGGFLGYDFEVLPSLHVVPEVDAYCNLAGYGCLLTGGVGFWFP